MTRDTFRPGAGALIVDRITESDLDALASLLEELSGYPTDRKRMIRELRAIRGDRSYILLGARLDGVLAGTAMGILCRDLVGDCRPFMVVENVIVSAAVRGSEWVRLMNALEREPTHAAVCTSTSCHRCTARARIDFTNRSAILPTLRAASENTCGIADKRYSVRNNRSSGGGNDMWCRVTGTSGNPELPSTTAEAGGYAHCMTSGSTMIRLCTETDFEEMYAIINDAAVAYRGVNPGRLCTSLHDARALRGDRTRRRVSRASRKTGFLIGVDAGFRTFRDVTLIRHAYVRTARNERRETGSRSSHTCFPLAVRPVLTSMGRPPTGARCLLFELTRIPYSGCLAEEEEKTALLDNIQTNLGEPTAIQLRWVAGAPYSIPCKRCL
jgi:hypothetical protein